MVLPSPNYKDNALTSSKYPVDAYYPDIRDCNSLPYSCFENYAPEANIYEESPITLPPELTEDYLEAERRAEEHFKMMEDATTIFEAVYWRILLRDVKIFVTVWSYWLMGKLLIVGKEITACIFLGSILLAAFGVLLTIFGPFRIKSLILFFLVYVIGSTFAMDGIEVPAFAMIGVTILTFFFFTKASTCSMMKSHETKKSVVLRFDFWYMGSRTLWVRIRDGMLGFHTN